VFNCEANLVFEDKADEKREGKTFDDRLGVPVSWDDPVDVDDIVWQDPVEAPEDAPSAKPHLPAFFAWASYSQTTGELRVGIDRTQPEPADWSFSLAGQSAEQSVSLFSRASCAPDGTTLLLTLDERSRGVHLTALRVSWTDKDAARQEAFLAVAVEDRDTDLLPPEEFRGLSVDGIIGVSAERPNPRRVDREAGCMAQTKRQHRCGHRIAACCGHVQLCLVSSA